MPPSLLRRTGLHAGTALAIVASALALAPAASAAAPVTTVNDLVQAVAAGGPVVLGADLSFSGQPVVVTGTTTLDLAGHDLTIGDPGRRFAGIAVPAGTSFTLLDSVGGGVLDVTGSLNGAGIGGSGPQAGPSASAGTIELDGGTVLATSGTDAAGIGGGSGGLGGSVVVDGADVTARGSYGAGVGSGPFVTGSAKPRGTVTVRSGAVDAAGAYAAGLGGGMTSPPSSVIISGGTVTAAGGYLSAGIGSGYSSNDPFAADVSITGGSVTATGASAGIGSGATNFYGAAAPTVSISGGTVVASASSGSLGAGIGGSGGTVDIIGSADVTAKGAAGAGVGGIGGRPQGNAGASVLVGPSAHLTAFSGVGLSSAVGHSSYAAGSYAPPSAGGLEVDGRLTLPSGSALRIPSGTTFVNFGTIDGAGTITDSGSGVGGILNNQGNGAVVEPTVVDFVNGGNVSKTGVNVAPNNYGFRFDAAGGDPVTGIGRVYARSVAAGGRSLPIPTRAGYLFTGWTWTDPLINGPAPIKPITDTTDLGQTTGYQGAYTVPLTATWQKIQAPTFSTTSLPAGTYNIAYDQGIGLAGIKGQSPITLAVTAGDLPPGLSLAFGHLSGTPTQAGTYTFTLTATSSGASTDQTFTVTIQQVEVDVEVLATMTYGTYPTFGYRIAGQTAFSLPAGLITGTPTCTRVGSTPLSATLGSSYAGLSLGGCSGLSLTDTANYRLVLSGGALTVNPLTVHVTPHGEQAFEGSPVFTYDSDLPSTLSMSGSPTCTQIRLGGGATAINPFLGADASYPIVGSSCSGLSVDGASSRDASVVYTDTGALHVSRQVVTLRVDGGQTYGGAGRTFTASGATPHGAPIGGTITCTRLADGTAIDAALHVGRGTIDPASCSGALLGGLPDDYRIVYAGGSFTVQPKQISLSADDQRIAFGDPDPVFTYTAVGVQPGDTLSGVSCAPSTNPHNRVGSYLISCAVPIGANPDYRIDASGLGHLTVAKRTVPVVLTGGGQTYGGTGRTLGYAPADGAPSVQITGAVTCDVVRDDLAVGSYPLTASGCSAAGLSVAGPDGDQYAVQLVDAGQPAFVVSPKQVSVTPAATRSTYGTAASAPQPTFDGFLPGDSAASVGVAVVCASNTDARTHAGTYPARSSCSGPATLGNYAFDYSARGPVTIDRHALAVTASDGTSVYGDQPGAVAASYDGFVAGDDASSLASAPTCGTDATATSHVGGYATVCSGGASDDYDLTYRSGSWQVTKRSLSVTASDGSSVYGDVPGAVSARYDGFVNGDGVGSLDTAAVCATAATKASHVGGYATSCSGLVDGDYSAAYRSGSWQVTKRSLSVTASDGSSVYGDVPGAVSARYDGFVNGDGPGALATVPTCGTDATATSHVGGYATVCSGGASGDYDLTYRSGAWRVSKRTLTVTASDGTSVYGVAPGAVTASYAGFVNGEGAAVLDTAPTCSTAATASSVPGGYATSCTGLADGDYAASYRSGTWTVTPAPVAVTTSATGGVRSLLSLQTTFTATVRHALTGAPVAGSTVTFTVNGAGKVCSAVTNASGVATCSAGLLTLYLGTPYTATSSTVTGYQAGQAGGKAPLL